MADFCYRLIVWMRWFQGLGAIFLGIGILAHYVMLGGVGLGVLAVATMIKRPAARSLASYASIAEYSGSVRSWSGLSLSTRSREDYTRIWLRNR